MSDFESMRDYSATNSACVKDSQETPMGGDGEWLTPAQPRGQTQPFLAEIPPKSHRNTCQALSSLQHLPFSACRVHHHLEHSGKSCQHNKGQKGKRRQERSHCPGRCGHCPGRRGHCPAVSAEGAVPSQGLYLHPSSLHFPRIQPPLQISSCACVSPLSNSLFLQRQ